MEREVSDSSSTVLDRNQKTRVKTEAAYHSQKSPACPSQKMPQSIRTLISIALKSRRQQEQKPNKVLLSIMPQIPQDSRTTNNATAQTNIQQKDKGEGKYQQKQKQKQKEKEKEKEKDNLYRNKVCHSMATTLIQIPVVGGVRSRKIKGSCIGKGIHYKNLYSRRVNNTLALYRSGKEHVLDLEFQQSQSNMQEQPEHKIQHSHKQINKILRRTFMGKEERDSEKQHTENSLFVHNSQIREDLEKLKKLLKGEHYNYMELNSHCPIKIHGLLSTHPQLPKSQN